MKVFLFLSKNNLKQYRLFVTAGGIIFLKKMMLYASYCEGMVVFCF